MNQLAVNPSRRTHFSTSYYINSKQCTTHSCRTSFFHGENDGSPHAWQHRTEGMKFQMCPVTYPRKTRKTLSSDLAGGKPLQLGETGEAGHGGQGWGGYAANVVH